METQTELMAQIAHDLRNQVAAMRAEAQLAVFRYNKSKDPDYLLRALEGVMEISDEIVETISTRMQCV